MTLQPILIAGSDVGLETDVKPYILPDKGYPVLENAYVFRERVTKREGLRLLGRLARSFSNVSIGTSGVSPWTFSIFSTVSPAITETNKEIRPGSVVIVIGGETFTDQGNGILIGSPTPLSNFGIINYVSGDVTITTSIGSGTAATISFIYYPALPTMGVRPREQPTTTAPQPSSFPQTIFFDTKYAYTYTNGLITEWIPGTTWNGNDYNLMWTSNYQGVTPANRLLFTTNFLTDAANPMRFTDGSTWTDFAPAITSAQFLFGARILIPYYGRLLALNTFEGISRAGAVNFFARCRFSQIGDPTATDAWRSDMFGKGGSIDAPTAEAIVSAIFFKNTLIVDFERSTWQLRYVGDYGIPFIWERISSDFGTQSTFSNILFDDGVRSIGTRAITIKNSSNVQRIDEKIPDLVFDFQNQNNGANRISGVRDYQRELVFWAYVNSQVQATYPTNVLVYNYRNQTFAQFRDSVTSFGTFNLVDGITWDSTNIFWDDEVVTWDNDVTQTEFPYICSGNQQGFIHLYGYTTPDQPSLSVTGITITPSSGGFSIQITVPNHNLQAEEIIMITNLNFISGNTAISNTINGRIFGIQAVVDANTLNLSQWSFDEQQYYTNLQNISPTTSSGYVGGGQVTLFPKLNVQTKDFNPYQTEGKQAFISYIDFLTMTTDSAEMSVNLYVDSSTEISTNLITGNKELETSVGVPGLIFKAFQENPCRIFSPQHSLSSGTEIQIFNVIGMTQLNGNIYIITVLDADNFTLNGVDATGFTPWISGGTWYTLTNQYFVPGSDYAWHRFFATSVGQFIRIQMTYDDNLMNNIVTHQQDWELNAINMYMKAAGKLVF